MNEKQRSCLLVTRLVFCFTIVFYIYILFIFLLHIIPLFYTLCHLKQGLLVVQAVLKICT